ncbi:hypothetical protein GW17_00041922 [Ensete ventricosum]|nr:hypothetical protein GW17_00041922 [Ensete ventricosum]
MVHYRPKSPKSAYKTCIYKPKLAIKQTKLGLLSLLQARYLLYKCRTPLQVVALASDADLPCELSLAVAGRPPAGGLGLGLAVGGRPCMWAGRGWSLLLTAFAIKMQ